MKVKTVKSEFKFKSPALWAPGPCPACGGAMQPGKARCWRCLAIASMKHELAIEKLWRPSPSVLSSATMRMLWGMGVSAVIKYLPREVRNG